MTPAQTALVAQLQRIADVAAPARSPGQVYACGHDFVLQHGVWYGGIWDRRWPQGPPKQCYGWAIALAAVHGLKYVEGYALAPIGRLAIPHAWNIDNMGRLVDGTWCNTGLAYLGVEFSVERADDATWNGDSCVLDDFKRKHPLLQQPWKGEDYDLRWPASERLEMYRDRDTRAMRRFLDSFHEEGCA